MLAQQRLIDGVRAACEADDRLDAALMYGSFAAGLGDAHSDVEFWLFFDPRRLRDVDPRAWCSGIAVVNHLVINEFGSVVAFFPGLIRGEFHFATIDDIPAVAAWPARGAPTDAMLMVDRRGALRPVLAALPERSGVPDTGAEVEALCGRFANWLVLAHQVTTRGETLRGWDALGHVHRHLLWMARLTERGTAQWLTPSRRAEVDLAPPVLALLRDATAPADPAPLRAALAAAWRYGRDCWVELARRHERSVPRALFAEIDAAMSTAPPRREVPGRR